MKDIQKNQNIPASTDGAGATESGRRSAALIRPSWSRRRSRPRLLASPWTGVMLSSLDR
jgi:hypothetical protein